jgi:putative NIF3 family GTP cyclohydrolase 1 type 2
MKVSDLMDFFKKRGSWVNWNKTCDQILWGSPDVEIKGISVGWKPSQKNLKEAYHRGHNVFITHEPLYLAEVNKFRVICGGSAHKFDSPIEAKYFLEENDCWLQKKEWLQSIEMVVVRCHDFWDDYPEIGVHGSWAKWLGFVEKPIETAKYYEVHDLGELSLKNLLARIYPKLKELGQAVLQYIGELDRKVHRIGLGTGAITDYRIMLGMGADVLLLTDDGTRLWESGQFSHDSGIPIILVNHAVAEEPGIRALSNYLKSNFPSIDIEAVPDGCLTRFWGKEGDIC